MNVKSIIRQIYDLGVADGAFETLGVAPRIGAASKIFGAIGVLTAGALIGAGAGLLLAPMKGRDLRDRAMERVGEVRERVRSRGEQVMARADDIRHEGMRP